MMFVPVCFCGHILRSARALNPFAFVALRVGFKRQPNSALFSTSGGTLTISGHKRKRTSYFFDECWKFIRAAGERTA